MKVLLVVDVQNDFVTGALANPEAQAKIPAIKKKIQQRIDEGWQVVFTQDTHFDDYDKTMEGKYLPTKHCLVETDGWRIVHELEEFLEALDTDCDIITFGAYSFAETISKEKRELLKTKDLKSFTKKFLKK